MCRIARYIKATMSTCRSLGSRDHAHVSECKKRGKKMKTFIHDYLFMCLVTESNIN